MPLPSRSDRASTPSGRADSASWRVGTGPADGYDPAPDRARCPVEAAGPGEAADDRPGPCAACSYRTRCIRFGWLSPGGHWFESHVVIAPLPGCRGHEQSAGDIARRFVRA